MARVEDSPWAIPVAQIASRAGQSKPIDADFPAPSGIGDSIVGIKEGEPVHVSGQFDSIVDGLIFTGRLVAPFVSECTRCLKPIQRDWTVNVTSFFPYEDKSAAGKGGKAGKNGKEEEVDIIAGEDEAEDTYPLLDGGAWADLEALLRDMGFEPKNVMRQNNLITYFKSSTHIEDLLTLIGAPGRALEIMSAKIEKEMRNTVNRRVNCDAANLDKAVLASREQVEAFTRLTESGAINDLPVKLQEVAVARFLQPERTLSELAATFDPPLTKSCLNHRIRKLMEIAKKEENE